MRNGLIGSLLVGLIVYVALQFVPATFHGNNRALVAAGIAFLASLIVGRYVRS